MMDIKETIKQEFIKSAQDPVHFMKKYCWIQHPTRGRSQFNLYVFQEKLLTLLNKHDKSIILKSRQLGISTLSAGIALHMMIFQKDKNILVIATKQETAKNLVTKVRFMYENLPSWMKLPTAENNRLSLRLSNGSQIKAVSAASDAGRSEAISLLVIDEAAFIEANKIEEIWGSAQQTLATGGRAIILSTPNGTGNWFHKMWTKAQEGSNGFTPIKLPWTVHPERTQVWRDKQDDELGIRMAAQECDCDFTTSGDTFFVPELINYIENTTLKDPLEKRGMGQNLWIWEYPDYTQDYMVVADVARGDGKDHSSFHIIDINRCVQVAEFKGQLPTKDFGKLLVAVSTEYNNATLIVENANIGWAVLQEIINVGYPNLYYSPKDEKYTRDVDGYISKGYDIIDKSKMVPGFTMSLKTRPLALSKLDAYVKENTIQIQSKRTLEEFRTFVWRNGRAEAQLGYNDDLVMSLAIACYVRDTALKFSQQGLELTKSVLNNISVKRYNPFYGQISQNDPNSSYKMDINGSSEDISWLL